MLIRSGYLVAFTGILGFFIGYIPLPYFLNILFPDQGVHITQGYRRSHCSVVGISLEHLLVTLLEFSGVLSWNVIGTSWYAFFLRGILGLLKALS